MASEIIKPIETVWRGYRFRSRLEARWAVFFTALGLGWEYEPEGFELGNGVRYLPDFKVRYPGRWQEEEHHAWFEVKGDPASLPQDEWEKLCRFEKAFGVTVLDGPPDARLYLSPSQWLSGVPLNCEIEEPAKPYKVNHEALLLKRWGCALWSSKGRLWWDWHDDFFHPVSNYAAITKIENAAMAARSARFEFGQAPA